MKKISIGELKQMRGKSGLVLQGCGGELQEWVDGIHKILTDEKILKDGFAFHIEKVKCCCHEEGTQKSVFLGRC